MLHLIICCRKRSTEKQWVNAAVVRHAARVRLQMQGPRVQFESSDAYMHQRLMLRNYTFTALITFKYFSTKRGNKLQLFCDHLVNMHILSFHGHNIRALQNRCYLRTHANKVSIETSLDCRFLVVFVFM